MPQAVSHTLSSPSSNLKGNIIACHPKAIMEMIYPEVKGKFNLKQWNSRWFHSFDRFFFFFLFWLLCGIWSSQVKDHIWATAAAMSESPTHYASGGSNPSPSAPETPLIPLRHGGNSQNMFLKYKQKQLPSFQWHIFLFVFQMSQVQVREHKGRMITD